MDLNNFKILGLSDSTLEALKAKGFEKPTEIQEKTIPLLLSGEKDIIGQARTGTGKTAAFGLPLIEKISENDIFTQAIILAPTRELAIQVTEEINSYKGSKRLFLATLYGGQSYTHEFSKLRKGVHIIVGTPGRVMDHLDKKTLDISKIKYFVLDEADEMLNMGFKEDIESILTTTPKDKKMLLFSATMPKEILHIAKKFMREYDIVSTKESEEKKLIEQLYFQVNRNDKFEALCRIIDMEDNFYGIIFCRTKNDVDELTIQLQNRGYDVDGLHGDIKQSTREKIIDNFKKLNINILLATDVAARGIDIQNLTHVINYSLPDTSEGYTHRIGRTGRAGKTGVAITFVTPAEHRRIFFIQKDTKNDIKKEKLPSISDVLSKKKSKLIENIISVLDNENYSQMNDIANKLLENKDPQSIVSAILKFFTKNEFETSNYKETEEKFDFKENKGSTRLFLAKGKNDGMTPKKVIELINEYINIESFKIKDIGIFDSFSFLNIPSFEAEELVDIIKKESRGKLPLITKAKNKPQGGEERRGKSFKGNGRRTDNKQNRLEFGKFSKDKGFKQDKFGTKKNGKSENHKYKRNEFFGR